MRLVCDFHIHSKYAQATSRFADLEHYALAAKRKGVDLLGTGDALHPEWRKELRTKLIEAAPGVFKLPSHETLFVLSAELCTHEERENKLRRIHHVVHFPSFDVLEQAADVLAKYGSLAEDGRPTLRLSPAELVESLKSISQAIELYPAHAWTPWFGALGSKSGYDSLLHAYEDKAHHIWGLETGLSSDPPMNWMVSGLDRYVLISNSDAHSPSKVGREANVLDIKQLSFSAIHQAMKTRRGFVKTYEFFPEEGKYHYDGHRKCGVCLSPWEAMRFGNICPVCRKKLTIGVLHRVVELADHELGRRPENAVPYQHIVPLELLVSKALGKSPSTKAVKETCDYLIRYFGSELAVFEAKKEDIALAVDAPVRDWLLKAVEDRLKWRPGYDGVFGELLEEKEGGRELNQATLSEFL